MKRFENNVTLRYSVLRSLILDAERHAQRMEQNSIGLDVKLPALLHIYDNDNKCIAKISTQKHTLKPNYYNYLSVPAPVDVSNISRILLMQDSYIYLELEFVK